MQRIFHTAGYHTIAISSQMSQQFMISASSNTVPGLLMEDNKDIYKAIEACLMTKSRSSCKLQISILWVTV